VDAKLLFGASIATALGNHVLHKLCPPVAWTLLGIDLILITLVSIRVVRMTWHDLGAVHAEPSIQSRTQLFKIVLLNLLMVMPILLTLVAGASIVYTLRRNDMLMVLLQSVISLVIVLPLLWWLVKASLAFVIMCLEPIGMLGSLRLSHQLLNGKFWLTAVYLFVPSMFVELPILQVSTWLTEWCKTTELAAQNDPLRLAIPYTAYFLVKTVTGGLGYITMPLIVRLYQHVTTPGISDQDGVLSHP